MREQGFPIPRYCRARFKKWVRDLQAKWGKILYIYCLPRSGDDLPSLPASFLGTIMFASATKSLNTRYGETGPGCVICNEPSTGNPLHLVPPGWALSAYSPSFVPIKFRNVIVVVGLMCPQCSAEHERKNRLQIEPSENTEWILDRVRETASEGAQNRPL